MTEAKRVLVVEDDSLVSDVIVAALDDRYPITVVETAAKAIAHLHENEVRLMLLDCTLPGGVSPDLMPMADRRGATVVLMSGDPSRGNALSDRPRRFLRKPFTLGGLLETVKAALEAEPVQSGTDVRSQG